MSFSLALSLLLLSAGPSERGAHDDATVRHSFEDVDHWTAVFDDPERDAWQKPDEVIAFLRIGSGGRIADLGAGTGYFTVRLARAVGESGKVYAIEIEPKLVQHLNERSAKAGLTQVVPVLAAPDDPKLEEQSVDQVLIVDTYHHIDDRVAYLRRLANALRLGGTVAVVDFKPGELPVGPPPGHKLAAEKVIEEFQEAGYLLDRRSDALPYQYVLVFRRQMIEVRPA